MSRPLRNTDPESYRLITIRTQEARLWITPSSKVKKLIGGILARYQEIFGILIYAYCVLGNHFHLLIKAPKGNTDEFCENVNREISRRLNWKHRREGTFWGRRYDDQVVLSEDALLEAFLYVTTNPTKHGLLRDSSEWLGLNSFHQAISEKTRQFSFYHYSAPEGGERVSTHALKLSVLPQFEGLSKAERTVELKKLLYARMDKIAEERKNNNQGFLSPEFFRNQIPGQKPRDVSRSPRPACYTTCPKRRNDYRREVRQKSKLYAEASFKFRLGELDTVFPEFCFKPPLHRAPRLIPFTPLSSPSEKNLI